MSLAASTEMHPDDTIVAVSSAPGPGARAIVRVSGPLTAQVIEAVFTPSTAPPPTTERCLVPGHLKLTGLHSPLPADLYRFFSPRSYTGQDLAELHTIGSPPLVERLVAELLGAGARPARPGEFTLRAFLAGKLDLPQAEAVQAVIEAGTEADLHTALKQLAGGATQPLHAIRDDLLNLLADLEASLDFAEEDIEFVGQSETLTRLAAALARLMNLRRQFESRIISGRPIRAVLVGEPNAGKSTLFNALTGKPLALVSEAAGTTRDYLTCPIELDGVKVELVDTAGWASPADRIEEQAQQLGHEQSEECDIVLWCVEAGQAFEGIDQSRLAKSGPRIIRVQTKSDRVSTGFVGEWVAASAISPGGEAAVRQALAEAALSLSRPALAPSQSRCRHHVESCIRDLQLAHRHVLFGEPAELAALALRGALQQLGEIVGAIYTNDLLDRIFSRFCIGK